MYLTLLVGQEIQTVYFFWVVSHIRVLFNKETDDSAVQTTVQPTTTLINIWEVALQGLDKNKYAKNHLAKLVTASNNQKYLSNINFNMWEPALDKMFNKPQKNRGWLTLRHLESSDQPLSCEHCGEDISSTIKLLLTGCPSSKSWIEKPLELVEKLQFLTILQQMKNQLTDHYWDTVLRNNKKELPGRSVRGSASD